MPLITCPDCSYQVSDAAPSCQVCGRPQESALMTRLGAYIGPNWSSHYQRQFQRLLEAEQTRRKPGWMWNWSAALTPFWFLYRQLYAQSFVFLALHVMVWSLSAASTAAARANGGADDGNPAGLFFLILFVVQGCCGDRLLFHKAREAVRKEGEYCNPAWLAQLGRPLAWVPWSPAALLVFAVIAGAMLDPQDAAVNRYRTAGAVEESPLEHVVFASSGGEIKVTAPITWRTFQDLSEGAELQVGSVRNEQFLIAFGESKTDLSAGLPLKRYGALLLEHARDSLTSDTVSATRTLTIQGRSAVQHVVRGTYKDARHVYWITAVETPDRFYRVVAWTPVSRAADAEPVIQAVIESFRENQPLAPAEQPASPAGGTQPGRGPTNARVGRQAGAGG